MHVEFAGQIPGITSHSFISTQPARRIYGHKIYAEIYYLKSFRVSRLPSSRSSATFATSSVYKVSLSSSVFFSFDLIFEKLNFVNYISLSNQISPTTVGEPKKDLFHWIIRKESYFSHLNMYFSLFNLRILTNDH